MSKHGNRITDNALTADSGEDLIAKALSDIEAKTEWRISDKEKFAGNRGAYYDSKKVGSFFVEVTNEEGTKGVLKLQLHPLPFDEGFIIRFIGKQIQSHVIRLPKVYSDSAWSEKDGYGFIIFEDLSHLPNVWSHVPTTNEDRQRHKKFLQEFMGILPVTAFVEKPIQSYGEYLQESFDHHNGIGQKSRHKHIDQLEVARYKEKYFVAMQRFTNSDVHFTHGHLTGLDVKVDESNRHYILLANLYWKWRPKYFEIAFPVWNDLMRNRGKDLTFTEFLDVLNTWNNLWQDGIYDHDPISQDEYWGVLLFFAMNTIMLDLGTSEWKDDEAQERQALLECWKEFFDWIIVNRLK